MDDTGGAGGFVPCHDGPGAAFVGPGGEEGAKTQQTVGALDEAHDAALLQPHLLQEHLAVFVVFDFGDLGLGAGGDDQNLGVFFGHGGTDGIDIGVPLGGRCLIYVADIQHGLVGEEVEVLGHLLFLGIFGHDRTAGFSLLQHLTVTEQQRKEFPGLLVSPGGGHFLHLLDAVFHRFQVFDLEFGIDDFLVADGVYGAVHMDDIVVVKAAEHMQDGVGFTDVGQELVAQPLAPGGTLHQTGDIDNLHGGGNGALGLADFRQDLQALVRNVGGAHIGVDGAKGEVGALGFPGTYTVK